MLYGHNKTWHQTKEVNVELDNDGKVVSVWFRCIALPFTQTIVSNQRAEEMERMYKENPAWPLLAVDVQDPKEEGKQ